MCFICIPFIRSLRNPCSAASKSTTAPSTRASASNPTPNGSSSSPRARPPAFPAQPTSRPRTIQPHRVSVAPPPVCPHPSLHDARSTHRAMQRPHRVQRPTTSPSADQTQALSPKRSTRSAIRFPRRRRRHASTTRTMRVASLGCTRTRWKRRPNRIATRTRPWTIPSTSWSVPRMVTRRVVASCTWNDGRTRPTNCAPRPPRWRRTRRATA